MKHGLNKAEGNQETSLKLNESVQTYLMANFRGILNEATIEHIGNMVADLLDDLNSENVFVDHRVQGSGEKDLLDVIEFARGAIVDACYHEDGLDEKAGSAVIRMINNELLKHGRTPQPLDENLQTKVGEA